MSLPAYLTAAGLVAVLYFLWVRAELRWLKERQQRAKDIEEELRCRNASASGPFPRIGRPSGKSGNG